MPRRIIAAVLIALPAAPAGAAPTSESLLRCAALFETPLRRDPAHARTEAGQAQAHLAGAFRDAAAVRARAEGRADLQTYIALRAGEAAAYWDARPATFVYSQEFTDWAGYCAALAAMTGLDLDALLDRT